MKVTILNPSGDSIEANGIRSSEYILYRDVSGLESPSYTHSTETTSFSDGSSYYGSYADPREISMTILLNAGSYSQMWNNGSRRELIKAINAKNGELTITFELDNGDQYSIYGVINGNPSIKQGQNNPNYAICNLDILCFDPWFFDPNRNLQEIALTTGGFFLPFSLPLFLGTYGQDTITNNGDVATPVLITINGPITNPTIENSTTGESIIVTHSLVMGEKLIINTDPNDTYVLYEETDGTQTSLFNAVDIDSDFFQLQPGANEINLNDTEDITGSTFFFSWYDRYSGV